MDRPFAGRRLSAVEQGYRYAVNLPCDWIIVTSMRETRLYFKGADQQTFERFEISRLAHDDEALKRFVFLLGAERVVPHAGRSHLYELRSSSEQSSTALTRGYYQRYAEILPIAAPSDEIMASVELAVRQLIDLTKEMGGTRRRLIDWLRVEHEVVRATRRLQNPLDLGEEEFVSEIRKVRGTRKPLTSAGLQSLRSEFANTIEPARGLGERMLALEEQVADAVYRAYGLTRSEIELIQRTAPPRMPLAASDSVPSEIDTSEAV